MSSTYSRAHRIIGRRNSHFNARTITNTLFHSNCSSTFTTRTYLGISRSNGRACYGNTIFHRDSNFTTRNTNCYTPDARTYP